MRGVAIAGERRGGECRRSTVCQVMVLEIHWYSCRLHTMSEGGSDWGGGSTGGPDSVMTPLSLLKFTPQGHSCSDVPLLQLDNNTQAIYITHIRKAFSII